MPAFGNLVEETGTLIREGGGFSLRREGGGLIRLDLHRMPVDHVEKPVRVRGVMIAADLIDVESIVRG